MQGLIQMFITLSEHEQKIQTYRQLLNEQIQFNLKDLYVKVSSNSPQVTAYHLQLFIAEQPNQQLIDINAVESVIKGYNCCTSMNLSFIQFALLFLSRENRLLAKLTVERNSLGDIPQYLLEHARKIIQLEVSLHKEFINFRKEYSETAQKWIKDNFDEQVLENICRENLIDPKAVIRYFKANDKESITIQKMLSLLTLKNCDKIAKFIKKTAKKPNRSHILCNTTDPFIRPEFHDCLDRPKILQKLSFREIKSIEKHLDRLNSGSKFQLHEKILKYREFMGKQLIKFCTSLETILQLEAQIQLQRVGLCLCTDFYPVLFFDSFIKDRQMFLLPSSLQQYLEKLGLNLQLNNLYVIFKRYSTRVDGKLDFNEFCSIFDVSNPQYYQIQRNRLVNSLEDINIDTIKSFLKLIKKLVKNELKIEQIKSQLTAQVNLREIYNIFDQDQDGMVSTTDFRVAWKKHLSTDISTQRLNLLWYRIKANKIPNTMLTYHGFIAEFTPKMARLEKNIKIKKPISKEKSTKTIKIGNRK